MKSSKGVKPRPRNILLYGEHGTGKTTLAATFPSPYLFDIEGGSGDLDVERGEDYADYSEFQLDASNILARSDISCVIIDTVDWLEKLIQRQVAQRSGKESIEDFGYGKGYTAAAEEFDKTYINHLRAFNRRGIVTVSICHAKRAKHTPPDGAMFERWEPDLHEKIQGPILEFCDEVLFIKKVVTTRSEDLGFNKKREIVMGSEQRVLVTSDTGSVVAKNRLRMPVEIGASYEEYVKYVIAAYSQAKRPTVEPPKVEPEPAAQSGNIAGIVVEGSSKRQLSEAEVELANTSMF